MKSARGLHGVLLLFSAVLSIIVAQGLVEGGRHRVSPLGGDAASSISSGERQLDQLENALEYQERENEAVARLYENVLDVMQCRPAMVNRQNEEPNSRAREEGMMAMERQPVQDQNWKSPQGLGQVSGVSVDPTTGRPVIFHRGDHVWEYDSFDESYQYTKSNEGPISVPTVLSLNPETGDVVDEWGSDLFYLPHGIHVDARGNVWLTDVALHQVFKFSKRTRAEEQGEAGVEEEPSLVLGQRFAPGSDSRHFCQPTAVATMPDELGGQVVVADGYCNDRVLVFDPEGRVVAQLPPYNQRDSLRLRVPHSLTVLKKGEVCVADREHQRIVCFDLARALAHLESANRYQEGQGRRKLQKKNGAGTQLWGITGSGAVETVPWPKLTVHRPGVCRIFGITSHENTIYGVNGPTTPNNPVTGFTLNPSRGSVVSTWGPTFESFTNPHEIAAAANGSALYISEIGPNVVWKFRLLTDWKM